MEKAGDCTLASEIQFEERVKSFPASNAAYEKWLTERLGGERVRGDLLYKREKIAGDAFTFLRGTYWRWSETVLTLCPELADAPSLPAIGDVHLENYGIWRDADERLVWGLNDFDEAAVMPYTLDLARLAASALLADPTGGLSAREICNVLLAGYRDGLSDPRPVILERDFEDLRTWILSREESREKFWGNLEALLKKPAPPRYVAVIKSTLPDPDMPLRTAHRRAGVGSLGRPRWVAMGEWRGGPVVREAKALLPSAWNLSHAPHDRSIRVAELIASPHRAPDPSQRVADDIVVRRLAPHARKLELGPKTRSSLSTRILRLMAFEIGNLHAADARIVRGIEADLARRLEGWLRSAVKRAAAQTRSDWEDWRLHLQTRRGPR